MRKKNLKSLTLNKKSISKFQLSHFMGGKNASDDGSTITSATEPIGLSKGNIAC
jgi:hypothetical protein